MHTRARCGQRVLAIVAACTAFTARVQATEIRWNAPDDCQRADTVADQVESLIGRPLSTVEGPSFVLEITRAADAWRLELVTVAAADGSRSNRVLSGPTCVAVTDAAGVAMALAIQASERPVAGPEAAEPAQEAPQPPPTAPNEVAAKDAAPRKPEVTPNAGPRFGALFGLGGTLDTAALPDPSPGLSAFAGFHWGAARVEVQGSAFLPSRTPAVEGQSGQFSLLAGALLACFEEDLSLLAAQGCGGFELGRLSGEGDGVSDPRLGTALWQAARLELGAGFPTHGRVRLLPRLGAAIPTARPEFQLDGKTVHQPGALTLRAFLGVEFRP